MERITGIRYITEPAAEEIKRRSEYSAEFLNALIKRGQITYNQILYPYADALSLSGGEGTESTRIFGTHILLRNVEESAACEAMGEAMRERGAEYELTEFTMYEGAVMAADVREFLKKGSDKALNCAGDFGELLTGYARHWRIRECARIYASFCEMAYRRTKGGIAGLCGGKLIILTGEEGLREAAEIYVQKTGETERQAQKT
ncbi:MAG: hypothetical protein IIZ08_06990 [Clostridia bacterium]|jgi:hypothetical protein|nr:hypothetical protein [Clostridia bacterium]